MTGDPPVDAEGETVTGPFRYAVSDDELPESGGLPATVVLALLGRRITRLLPLCGR